MKTAYVTWRGDHDEFFVTQLDYEDDVDYSSWSSHDWVSQAADAEEEDWTWGSYELISVVIVPYGVAEL